MQNVLITYDLIPTHRNYTLLINRIREIAGKEEFCWSELKSVWIIRTSSYAKQVFGMLSSYVDENDKLLVLDLDDEGSWQGFNDKQSKFLNDYL